MDRNRHRAGDRVASLPDWEGALWEAIAHLQTLIRLDTVNPPGNEIGVARYLDDVLRGAGIETTLLEPAPGRAALIARLRGSGRARPFLLMAHMDVVGVERDKWTTNPFGGEVLDGYVYGRGAIDDKGMLAVLLQVLLLLRRHVVDAGGALDRDVVLLATSDEEGGGSYGIDWLVAHHAALIDAEFALNEGGRLRSTDGRLAYAAVQCAEKTSHVVRVVAHGPSGHASVPRPDNALNVLARAVDRIARHREPVVLTPVTRQFFAGLAPLAPDETQRAAMRDVSSDDPARIAAGAAVLATHPALDAVLRNGISPTMLSGGIRTNVIPAEGAAALNVRTLPGASIEELLGRLREEVGDDRVTIDLVSRGAEAPASPTDGAPLLAIREAVSALAPGVPTLPYLSTGATDSAALRRLGVQAYGLLPFPLDPGDEARMHGHDERVPIASIDFGLNLVYDVVRRVAAA